MDPELETIEIYRRAADAHSRDAVVARAGRGVDAPLLPGFPVPLADVFAPPFPD